ncbi:MAG: response regulator [Chloroflexota bacterium]
MDEPKTSNKKRILIVDDEAPICDVCQRVLTAEGYNVDCVANGRKARSMITQKQYDLYLFDIRLPEMDGKALYQWLQEKHPSLTRKVVLTTGDVIGQDTQSFIEETGRLFLPKPFTPDELKAAVRKISPKE